MIIVHPLNTVATRIKSRLPQARRGSSLELHHRHALLKIRYRSGDLKHSGSAASQIVSLFQISLADDDVTFRIDMPHSPQSTRHERGRQRLHLSDTRAHRSSHHAFKISESFFSQTRSTVVPMIRSRKTSTSAREDDRTCSRQIAKRSSFVPINATTALTQAHN